MKVFVYFNLHRKLWSVKALEGPNKGRVIDHSCLVALRDCTYKVSEAGRQRVLREQRKNVHAGVVGYLVDEVADLFHISKDEVSKPVTYNPYRFATFVEKHSERPIYRSRGSVMRIREGGLPVVMAVFNEA